MNGIRRSFIAGFVVVIISFLLIVTATSANAQKYSSFQEPTTAPSPTPTLTAGGQIAQTVNGWQKDLADPGIAIGKFLLTLVILVLLIGFLIYLPVRLVLPSQLQNLLEWARNFFARLREEQIIIADFENAVDKDSDFLVKIVKARMAEELREWPKCIRDREFLKSFFEGRFNPINPKAVKEGQIKETSKFIDELESKVDSTEIKALAMIIRWLFPVQGTKVSGHLVKVGKTLQDHGLVVEISELAGDAITHSHTFWGSIAYCRSSENASLPTPAGGKKQSGKAPQKAEYALGLLYEEKGLYGDAKTHYESALKIDPAYSDALAGLDRVLNKEDTNAAEIYFKMAGSATQWVGWHIISKWLPKSRLDRATKTQIYISLGNLFNELCDYEDALEEFEEAGKLDPDSYFPYWNLGNAYSYMNKMPESIEAYEHGLKLARNIPEAKADIQIMEVARANSLWAFGKKDDANKSVNTVVKSPPSSAQVMYELACFYSNAGEAGQGLRWLKGSLRDKEYREELGDWAWHDPDLENLRKEKGFGMLFPQPK